MNLWKTQNVDTATQKKLLESLPVIENFIQNHQLYASSTQSLITFLRQQNSEKYVVAFLVHHLHAWFSVSEIWRVMNEAKDFLPVVISIPHRFKNASFVGEEQVHDFLNQNRIPHIRFNFYNHDEGLNILKSLAPDILIRQAHWDKDIPDPYGASHLNFTKLLYTDYGLEIIEDTKIFQTPDGRIVKEGPYDSDLHRRAWMILCANQDQREIYKKENPTLNRIFVTGYPKFDALCSAMKDKSYWPIQKTDNEHNFRIIWAPHHSIGQHPWFGVFDKIYKDMLEFARHTSNIDIVLRPHPALLEQTSVPSMPNFHSEMKQFLEKWQKLPNTAISLDDNYAHLFAASDCMISDGISFLAEYPLSGKPLIFFNNPNHTEFNSLGKKCIAASYSVHNMDELKEILKKLIANEDPLQETRENLKNYLMPYKGHAAKRVLEDIREEFPK